MHRLSLILSFVWISQICCTKNSHLADKLHIDLIAGNSSNHGYLAVFVDQNWYFICNKFWDNRNSKVICKELGYDKVFLHKKNLSRSTDNASIYPQIHMNYQCEGSENALNQCPKKHVDQISFDHSCKPDSSVYITCSHRKESVTRKRENSTHAIKLLQNGNRKSVGLLLSYDNGEWRNVCVTSWSVSESYVACQELGYSNFQSFEKHTFRKTTFTSRAIDCHGNETNLSQCFRDLNKLHSCYGILLTCYQTPYHQPFDEFGALRLRGGSNSGEGRVEVFANHAWGTICDDGWSINNADVVCRQLGFGAATEATHWAEHGQGVGKIHYRKVNCFGNESKLLDCERLLAKDKCTHLEDAGVRCQSSLVQPSQKIRLFGSKNRYEGRVEVYENGGWYGICGIGFTQREGQVVCRQLGRGYVQQAYRGYKFGINYDQIMFDVKCRGNESHLHECSYERDGRCRYYDMASVVCTKHAPDLVMDIDTFSQSIKLESRPLYRLTCAFEEKCLDPVVDRIFYYNRNHRRTLLRFSSRFVNLGAVSFATHQKKSDWKWHSCHKHYHSMEVFAIYDLVDSYGKQVAVGHKASFCLEDSECENGYRKVYNCSNKGDQGISVNCADNYKNTLDCQWIDITDVPYGNYSLSVTVNPKQLVGESDWLNNRAVCELHYFGENDINVRRCNAEPCYQASYGGNGYGHCCHFPFIYNNVKYYTCIEENSDRPWCATTYHFQRDKTWGYCNEIV